MIITLSNGTKIELSHSEMTELAKHSVDMFSPMAMKSMEMATVAAPVATKTVQKRPIAMHGSVLKSIREHYKNNKIDCKHKIYRHEYEYRRNHGCFSWEHAEA